MPALIFSDMKIVQADGSPFADSFLKTEKLPNGVEHPHFYFVQNNVSGCVTLFNQALKNLVLKNSDFLKRNLEKIPMHDFFLATTAATFGKIYFVNKTLSAYRMHERNTLGVQNVTSLKHVLDRLNRQSADMERILRYAEFFVEYFKENLGRGELQVLQEWVSIPSRSKFFRIHFMLKNGFMKYGIFRKCVQLWNA
jgi:rhamnosyltransferase